MKTLKKKKNCTYGGCLTAPLSILLGNGELLSYLFPPLFVSLIRRFPSLQLDSLAQPHEVPVAALAFTASSSRAAVFFFSSFFFLFFFSV